ncbi:hypothetical protein [Actinoplanes sp. NPDC049802]|uniref:hypothetical protein n=1 Tax=Actinoplanes sp. NPDC049802 TaxID=3154742 RepID=UPI0033DB6E95
MSPLAFGAASGSLGTCRTHGRPLVRRMRGDLAEQVATERAAEDSRRWLAEEDGEQPAESVPIPRQSARRRGDCPKCLAEIGAAALAYLNGEDAA